MFSCKKHLADAVDKSLGFTVAAHCGPRIRRITDCVYHTIVEVASAKKSPTKYPKWSLVITPKCEYCGQDAEYVLRTR